VSLLRLGIVAASVSEWRSDYSLALVATFWNGGLLIASGILNRAGAMKEHRQECLCHAAERFRQNQQMRPSLPEREWPGGLAPTQRPSMGSLARW